MPVKLRGLEHLILYISPNLTGESHCFLLVSRTCHLRVFASCILFDLASSVQTIQ